MDRVSDKRERSTEQALDEDSKRLKSAAAAAAAATEELDRYMSKVKRETLSVETMIDLIGKKGADPNHQCGYDRFTPLMELSSMGAGQVDARLHDEIMKGFIFLLQIPNIDVNLTDRYGNVLIQRAVYMEDPAFLTLLLQKEASREHINNLGMVGLSALHIACSSMLVSIQSIQSLLKVGANPYLAAGGQLGYTPLFYAIKECGTRGAFERLRHILEIFLDHGVDLARNRDNRGDTIMHLTVRYVMDEGLCKFIVNHGGYKVLYTQNNAGKNALIEARDLNRHDAIHVLRTFLRRTPSAG
jgi:ankyrin repeat protein